MAQVFLRNIGSLRRELSLAKQKGAAAQEESGKWRQKYFEERAKTEELEAEVARLQAQLESSSIGHHQHQANAAVAYAMAVQGYKEHFSQGLQTAEMKVQRAEMKVQKAVEAKDFNLSRAVAAEAEVQEVKTAHQPLHAKIKVQSTELAQQEGKIDELSSKLAGHQKVIVKSQQHIHTQLVETQQMVALADKAKVAVAVAQRRVNKIQKTAAAEQEQLKAECDVEMGNQNDKHRASLEKQKTDFRQKSKVTLERTVIAEKRARVLGIEVAGATAKVKVLAEKAEQAAQLEGELKWVSGRREAFITSENIQASAFDGGDNCKVTSAMKAWKATTVKIKSSCLFTPAERKQCYSFIKAELEASADGIIQVKAPGAVRSIQLCHVPKAIVSSEGGSSRTLRRRNAAIDTIFRMMCQKDGASDDERKAAVISQLSAHMKRRRERLYKPAMAMAGIRSCCDINVENAAALKNSMSDNLWRFVKSFLDKKCGIKAASAAKVQKFTEPTQLPYEAGTCTNTRGEKGSFVRVKSAIAALKHQVAMHVQRGTIQYPANVPATEAWFHWQFDKGTGVTKFISKLIIVEEADSVDNVIVLAMFSGMKDDHEGLGLCMGPLFKEYNEIMSGETPLFITGLPFKRVPLPAQFLKLLPPSHPTRTGLPTSHPAHPGTALYTSTPTALGKLPAREYAALKAKQQERKCRRQRASRQQARLRRAAQRRKTSSPSTDALRKDFETALDLDSSREVLPAKQRNDCDPMCQCCECTVDLAAVLKGVKHLTGWIGSFWEEESVTSVWVTQWEMVVDPRREKMDVERKRFNQEVERKRFNQELMYPWLLGSRRWKAQRERASRSVQTNRCLVYDATQELSRLGDTASLPSRQCHIGRHVNKSFRVMEDSDSGSDSDDDLPLGPLLREDKVGEVASFDSDRGTHLIKYTDGDSEEMFGDQLLKLLVPLEVLPQLPPCAVYIKSVAVPVHLERKRSEIIIAGVGEGERAEPSEVLTQIRYNMDNQCTSGTCAVCRREVGVALVAQLSEAAAELQKQDAERAEPLPKRARGWINSDMKANDDMMSKQQSSGCTYYCQGCTAHLNNRSRPKRSKQWKHLTTKLTKAIQKEKKQSGPATRRWTIHAPHTLSTYKGCDTREEGSKISRRRKFEVMAAQGKAFKADHEAWNQEHEKKVNAAKKEMLRTGRKQQKISRTGEPEPKDPKYESMYGEPLVTAGETLDALGSCALHISIGVENDGYDLFERAVRDEDAKLLAAYGAARLSGKSFQDVHTGLSKQIDDVLGDTEAARVAHAAQIKRLVITLPTEISAREAQIAEMKSEDEDAVGWALKKTARGAFIEKDEVAVEIQNQYKLLTDSLDGSNKAIGLRHELVQAKAETELGAEEIAGLEIKLLTFDGPLMTQVRELLVEFRAQKQVFHGGHFNGPDLEKMMTPYVIERLVAILSPQRFTAADVGKDCLFGLKLPPMTVGSFELAEKFRTMFNKLRQLRVLYRPTRGLCKHEVAQLQARAISIGHWFPINFPNSSITPKMHWLIYHIPDIAYRHGSSGQTGEQAIESLHANMNVHGRFYVCIQNELMKLASQMKNQWARAYQGSVRSQSNNKKQQPNHKRKKNTEEHTQRQKIRLVKSIRKTRWCFSFSRLQVSE